MLPPQLRPARELVLAARCIHLRAHPHELSLRLAQLGRRPRGRDGGVERP